MGHQHLLAPSLRPVLALAGVLTCTKAMTQEPALRPVVVRNVTVIDTDPGASRPGMSVVIRGDRIVALTRSEATVVPSDARVIDGAGKYAIPGLWDMHVHVAFKRALQLSFPLFIANGVTGIREMGGCLAEQELAHPDWACGPTLRHWETEVRAGRRVGPRIVAIASYYINEPLQRGGDDVADLPPFFNPGTSAEGRRLAHALAAQPAINFAKTYAGIPRAAYFAFMREAKAIGLEAAGHVPSGVSMIEASSVGQRSVEHALRVLWDCYPGAVNLRAATERAASQSVAKGPPYTTALRREMVEQHSRAMCAEVFRHFVKNGTWCTPTHVTRRFEAFAGIPEYMGDPRLKFIPADRRRRWQADADSMVAQDSSRAGRKAYMDIYLAGLPVTLQAHEIGVKILAGSDANDSYVFPGFGLHDELAELVKAGLTPAQALRAATVNPAAFMHESARYGTIEVGKVADIVLLSADPLRDIANTRAIATVIARGRVFERAELDRLLEAVERAARGDTLPR